MNSTITIGSDPEFLVRSRREGRIVSAIPLMSGYSKDIRKPLGDGFEVFPDNVNIEVTMPPAESADELVDNIHTLGKKLDAFLNELECEAVVQAAHNYCMDRDLNTDEAFHFGCRPEFVAYQDESGSFIEYDRPDMSEIGTLRVCGGHIHIGRSDWKECNDDAWLIEPWSRIKTTRALDLFLGIALTLIDKDPSSKTRKKLYGRAGSMRETPYGLEYRTLSNFWLSSDATIRLVFDLVLFAVNFAEQNPGLFESSNETVNFSKIQQAINTGDNDACIEIIANSPLPAELKDRIFTINQQITYNPILK